jgi:hypothetical protein
LITRLIDFGRAETSDELCGLGINDPRIRDGFGRCVLLGDKAWRDEAATISEYELRNLIRGVILLARNIGWFGGGMSPVIPLFWEYARRFPKTEPPLTRWIAENRNNENEPFKGYPAARSVAEYNAMRQAATGIRNSETPSTRDNAVASNEKLEGAARRPRPPRVDADGRAYGGSQMLLQAYVNSHQPEIDRAISTALGLPATRLRWLSPVPPKFKEFRDGEFLKQLELQHLTSELRSFWPASGPRWDGLATANKNGKRVIVLVEAKSYPREVRGGGCKASDKNGARKMIEKSLKETADFIGVDINPLWTGALYQYANRLAHAVFLKKHNVDAVMVNVCFANEDHPARRTSVETWTAAFDSLKQEVGFHGSHPSWLAEVILPAVDRMSDAMFIELLASQPNVSSPVIK